MSNLNKVGAATKMYAAENSLREAAKRWKELGEFELSETCNKIANTIFENLPSEFQIGLEKENNQS